MNKIVLTLIIIFASANFILAQITELVIPAHPPMQEALNELTRTETKNLIFALKKNKVKKAYYYESKGNLFVACDFNREGLPVNYVEFDSNETDTTFKAQLAYNSANKLVEYNSWSKIYGVKELMFFYDRGRLGWYQCKDDESSCEKVVLLYDDDSKIRAVSEMTIEGKERYYEFFRGENGKIDSIVNDKGGFLKFKYNNTGFSVVSSSNLLGETVIADGSIIGNMQIQFSYAERHDLEVLMEMFETKTNNTELKEKLISMAKSKQISVYLYLYYYDEKGLPDYIEYYGNDFVKEKGKFKYEFYED